MKYPLIISALCGTLVFTTSCDSTDDTPEPAALEAQLAENVPADPSSGRDPVTGAAISNNLYTLFDLEENAIVLSSAETNAEIRQRDSTGSDWDIGLKGTTIIFNGGTSGPGEAAAQLLIDVFASVTEAPESGYYADGENTSCPAVETPFGAVPGTPLAICTGSDNGWYNYNSTSSLTTPIPGRTIVLKTARGNYAKIRILSYYQDNPDPPDASALSRYYTFEYILQPDGSRNLETTISQ